MSIIRITALAFLSFGIGACGVLPWNFSPRGEKYHYTYALKMSAEDNPAVTRDQARMSFQDENLNIQFFFDDAAIHFRLRNLSGANLNLDLARSYISIDQRAHPVCHSLNFYSDTIVRPAILSLPPQGYTDEYVAPRENIYFDGSKWREKDLFPSIDRNSDTLRQVIQRHVGKSIAVGFPVVVGQTERSYVFEFQVTAVAQIPWENHQPPKRSPPPPQKPSGIFTLDQVTTGIVVAGLLGFSAYLLTLSKDTPADIK